MSPRNFFAPLCLLLSQQDFAISLLPNLVSWFFSSPWWYCDIWEAVKKTKQNKLKKSKKLTEKKDTKNLPLTTTTTEIKTKPTNRKKKPKNTQKILPVPSFVQQGKFPGEMPGTLLCSSSGESKSCLLSQMSQTFKQLPEPSQPVIRPDLKSSLVFKC